MIAVWEGLAAVSAVNPSQAVIMGGVVGVWLFDQEVRSVVVGNPAPGVAVTPPNGAAPQISPVGPLPSRTDRAIASSLVRAR